MFGKKLKLQKLKKEKINKQTKILQAILFANYTAAMDWMFISSQHSYLDILMPKLVLGGEAFWEVLGQQGRALTNGISALGPRELVSSFCQMRTEVKGSVYKQGNRCLSRHQITGSLDLGLPSLQNCKK